MPTSDAWNDLAQSIAKLQQHVSRSQAVNVNAAGLRQKAKDLVQLYFRQTRPELQSLALDASLISQLDGSMQRLLNLANGVHSKQSYLSQMKQMAKTVREMEGAIELRHAEKAFLSRNRDSLSLSNEENIIHETLLQSVPTAALSYKQALIDLTDKNRISYRGIANELRETLRETLDYLAPDKMVAAQPNFKYEKDKRTPTMKQKARFVLKARDLPDNALRPPEQAIEIVEELVASFTRSVYERSSISTHVATQRGEVLRLKKYVDTVLSELLGLQV